MSNDEEDYANRDKSGEVWATEVCIIGLAILCVLGLLFGCSPMPTRQVSGLDNLKVTLHPLSLPEVIFTCANRLGMPLPFILLGPPIACTTVILETWTCDIYYAKILEGITIEHEREHCDGRWHDDALQDYRDRWRSNNERDM